MSIQFDLLCTEICLSIWIVIRKMANMKSFETIEFEGRS